MSTYGYNPGNNLNVYSLNPTLVLNQERYKQSSATHVAKMNDPNTQALAESTQERTSAGLNAVPRLELVQMLAPVNAQMNVLPTYTAVITTAETNMVPNNRATATATAPSSLLDWTAPMSSW